MVESLYAPPSALAVPAISWPVSSADPLYPAANAATEDPEEVAKAVATTATVRATIASAQLVGFAAIHTNWAGLAVTLSNNGGMTPQVATVVDPADELGINVYWDLRGVAGTTATAWDIAVAGAATPVAVGRLIPILAWETLRLEWRYRLGERHPNIEHRTGHGKRLVYDTANRYRIFTATANNAEDHAKLVALRRETRGALTPFPFVPNTADPDVLLVQFAKDLGESTFEYMRGGFSAGTAVGRVLNAFEVEEVSAGVPL